VALAPQGHLVKGESHSYARLSGWAVDLSPLLEDGADHWLWDDILPLPEILHQGLVVERNWEPPWQYIVIINGDITVSFLNEGGTDNLLFQAYN
jgi:hypothetical protein